MPRPLPRDAWTEEPPELWTGEEDQSPQSLPPYYDPRTNTYSYVIPAQWTIPVGNLYSDPRYVNGGQRVQ